jgi:hypothetical protein
VDSDTAAESDRNTGPGVARTDGTSSSRWAISDPMHSGLGRLTSQRLKARLHGPDNRGSCAIHRHHQDGRLRPWVDPDSPGAGSTLALQLVATPPAQTRSTRPTPSRRPRWGTDGHVSAGLGVGVPFRHVCSAFCVLCVESARLTFRLHRNLTLRVVIESLTAHLMVGREY